MVQVSLLFRPLEFVLPIRYLFTYTTIYILMMRLFSGFDWKGLMNQNLTPPFKPDTNK